MKQHSMEARVLTTFPLFMHKVFHDYHPDTEPFALNRTQMKALMIIHIESSPHMTKVCYHMNMEKGSLTPVIDSLIESGLVERRRNPNDRRKIDLSLTDKGTELVLTNLQRVHEHILKKLARLPKEEVQRFKRAVHDLHEITLKL
jgi:DNA-binding MarR family transcriptional regulator